MTRGDILGHGIYAHGNICKQNKFVSIFKSIVFYEYLLIKRHIASSIFMIWDVFFLTFTSCNTIWNAATSAISVCSKSRYTQQRFCNLTIKLNRAAIFLTIFVAIFGAMSLLCFLIESHFKKLKINRELWQGFIIQLKQRIINGTNSLTSWTKFTSTEILHCQCLWFIAIDCTL